MHNKMKILTFTLSLFTALSISAQSQAEQDSSLLDDIVEPAFGLWSLAAVSKNSPFKQVDSQVKPALLVFGGYGDVFAEGNRFGYSLYRDGTNFISLVANIRSNLSLDQEQIDDSQFLSQYKLDTRKNAFEAGLQIGRRLPMDWIGRIAILQDISGAHKAQEVDATVFRRDQLGPIRLLTTLGVQYQSKQLNDYYFGVDQDELALTSQTTYQADDGVSYELELIATYDFKIAQQHDLAVYLGLRNYYFSQTVKDSPLVKKASSESLFAGIGYYF